MDGALIATIVPSSLAVATAIGGGFWKLWVKIGEQNTAIGEQNKAIGRLEGKMDGVDTTMHSYEKQMEGFDTRVARLEERVDGFVNTSMKRRRHKE